MGICLYSQSVAVEMGVGELYGLFACIVARRSWNAVSQGIKNKKMDTDEVIEPPFLLNACINVAAVSRSGNHPELLIFRSINPI